MTLFNRELSPSTVSVDCQNWVLNRRSIAQGPEHAVVSPYTGKKIGSFKASTPQDVQSAIATAHQAFQGWAEATLKERTQVLFKFRETLLAQVDEISAIIASESGKLPSEAKAGLMKGIEVTEYALSLQNSDIGGKTEVSRGVWCEYKREPLGVVVGITPFNFPAMVPLWMIPIALVAGNSFVWKPSDKTPLTSMKIAEALQLAGLPEGVFTVLQGERETVEALCGNPLVKAIGFVGSSPVAQSVYEKGTASGKRVLALGGSKNPIILMPDADPHLTPSGIVASFTGCAGQRCMAASLLLAVEPSDAFIRPLVEKAQTMKLGIDMGAIISEASLNRLRAAIDHAEKDGAKILVDGRKTAVPSEFKGGYWLGPTILDHVRPETAAACDELFGPVLSIVRCKNLSEAIALENKNPWGNAASVFTSSPVVANEVARRAQAGMVGINIGVPVPREPFSFGGWGQSRFGYGDITGPSGYEFWSNLKKITTKWTLPKDQSWLS